MKHPDERPGCGQRKIRPPSGAQAAPLHGSWMPESAAGPFYLDGAVGYANTHINMTRVIAIPGLPARVA